MSAPQNKWVNLFAYSESLKAFNSITAAFLIKKPVQVVDSKEGEGGYSFQLNVNMRDGRWVQNVVQIAKLQNFAKPGNPRELVLTWQTDLSDKNGNVTNDYRKDEVKNLETLPLDCMDPYSPPWGVELSFNHKDGQVFTGIAFVKGFSIQGRYGTRAKPLGAFYDGEMIAVSAPIVGSGNFSQSTFGPDSEFEAYVFPNGVDDLKTAGRDDVEFFGQVEINGKPATQTGETSNLYSQLMVLGPRNYSVVYRPF